MRSDMKYVSQLSPMFNYKMWKIDKTCVYRVTIHAAVNY